jgi:hypothetical protein
MRIHPGENVLCRRRLLLVALSRPLRSEVRRWEQWRIPFDLVLRAFDAALMRKGHPIGAEQWHCP